MVEEEEEVVCVPILGCTCMAAQFDRLSRSMHGHREVTDLCGPCKPMALQEPVVALVA